MLLSTSIIIRWKAQWDFTHEKMFKETDYLRSGQTRLNLKLCWVDYIFDIMFKLNKTKKRKEPKGFNSKALRFNFKGAFASETDFFSF